MRIFALLFLLLLTQCTTTPDLPQELTDIGLWSGKAQLLSGSKHNRKWVNVYWASDSRQRQMRVDVSAILDIPVATFMNKNGEYHLWVMNEKKHYRSNNGQKLFQFLTKLSVNPDIFFSLLGKPLDPGPQWQCQDKKMKQTCVSTNKKLRYSVNYEQKNHRTIWFKKESQTMKLRLDRSKVEVPDKLFKPLPLSQFETIQI